MAFEQLNAALWDEPLTMAEIMRIALVSRLRMFKGDRYRTAESLGVGKTSVYRWIRLWEITEDETQRPEHRGYKTPRYWTRKKKSEQ